MKNKSVNIRLKLLANYLQMTLYPLFRSKKLKSIYNFKIKSITGGTIDFKDFKGKKLLLVNTASKCGLTSQYEQLEQLYTHYYDRLVIIGFPSNNFRNQEPGSDEDITLFCKTKYGVTFPLSSKIDVRGDKISPIYRWLTNKSENGVLDIEVTWNFYKFLISENGRLLSHFKSDISPISAEILRYIDSSIK